VPIASTFHTGQLGLREKLWNLNWSLVVLLALTTSLGVLTLYSAANGSWDPWASRHAMRFGACVVMLLVVALIDIRFWMRQAYLIYGLALLSVISVEFIGSIGMGAQRWITLGPLSIQPSELMKISLVLALARYFHGASEDDPERPFALIIPVILILLPAVLVMRQPDLGTALMLTMIGAAVLFIVGVSWWMFAVVGAATLATMPVAWSFLRDYQRNRILTFLDPESDPLGAGYHIMQSKIALGSGGVLGKGFVQGTQSHLNFLPEKQTDFIFTMFAEEFGLLGALVLLGLYMLLIAYGFAIGLRVRNHFSRVLSLGLSTMLFLYVFINIAMVMGLVPVVGVPLPLISYGGTAMLAIMFGFGLMLSASIHRDAYVGRHGGVDSY
jgi:rod shape determining protein RodA